MSIPGELLNIDCMDYYGNFAERIGVPPLILRLLTRHTETTTGPILNWTGNAKERQHENA